ncbi:MAG: choice-of-anchor tandem repeat GloVer-containing protein [Bacteroidota bacterium]
MKHLISAALVLAINLCFGQANTWTSLENFGGNGRDLSASFSIGSKVYVGTGLIQSTLAPLQDVWEYDIASGTWTHKNDFEGAKRIGAVGFSINGKGYIGLGGDLTGNSYSDLWEYDPATDDWTKKADFPGGARAGSFVFVVNNKAYIGAGEGPTVGYNDLWEYDPATNAWTQKLSLPAAKRVYAAAFAIGTKGYVGTGQMTDDDPSLNDFWEYDVPTNQWTQKANYPLATAGTVSFATSTRGYVALGDNVSIYSYSPATNTWTPKADFPEDPFLVNGVAAFANGKAYIGTGIGLGGESVTWYSYTPGTEQTISFNALPAKAFGDANFALTATSSSALAVSYSSSDTNVATISGSTVTIKNAGTTVITATQAGNATFDPAAAVQQTLTVNKANQTITFNALSAKNVNDAPFALTASATSTLTVSFASSNTNVATISGNTVTIVAAGITTITASQAGNGNYNAATVVTHDLVINKVSQTITFGPLSSKPAGSSQFTLSATASSGLTVSYVSSNTNVATVSGNTVTVVGGGATVITASQAGNATYAAATSVDQSFTVTKGSQSWVGTLPATGGYGTNITLALHLSSNLPYTLTSSNTSAATVAFNGTNWIITPTGIGTTTLTASNAGNASFDAVTDLTASLVISKGTQTITFPDIPTLSYASPYRYLIMASASSGLPLTFESSSTTGEITISGNVVNLYTSFNGTITAKQAGNDLYLPAQITKNIVVNRTTLNVTMAPIPDKIVGDLPFRPAVTPDVGYQTQQLQLSSTNTAVAKIINNMVNIVGKGTTTISVSYNADSRYFAASASRTLNVKDQLVITMGDVPAEKTFGDAPFDVITIASPVALPITFASSDQNVATVSGNTVTIVGSGNVVISATAGDANYATTTVSKPIHVKGPALSVTAQGQLFGVQTYGGAYKSGSIYKTNSDGTGVVIAKSFTGETDKGRRGTGTPVLASNGKIYGFTTEGGANGNGIFFEYDPATKKIVKKYDVQPFETITQKWRATPNGKIYGVKSLKADGTGGPIIAEFDVATGVFTKEVALTSVIGYAYDFVIASNGKMYVAGTFGTGAVFVEYDPTTNNVTTKAQTTTTPDFSRTGMVELNGKFYGTTQIGGAANDGFIFEFDPVAGTVTQQADFPKSTFNTNMPHGLIRSSKGKLYGQTTFGGANQVGYVFEYDPIGHTINKLADFPFFYGSARPNMVEGPDGIFYGSGYAAQDSEFFFDFNPANNLLRIVSLVDKSLGQSIAGDFVLLNDKFIALAAEGGGHGIGSVVEFDYTTKIVTRAADFGSGTNEGYYPRGGVTAATNGKLYGVTYNGGANDDGTIFEYEPATDEVSTVVSFSYYATGSHPQAKLTMGINGKLYGATREGGAGGYSGTIFEFDPASYGLRILANNGPYAFGGSQRGEVAVSTKTGKIYAITSSGGDNGNGAVLELDPITGEVKKVYSLTSADGYDLENGVMMASNDKLYGTFNSGGSVHTRGGLFEFDIDAGTYSIKHEFDDATGSLPVGCMIELNGKLYGMTSSGGASSRGVIYEYDLTSGVYTKKHEFTVGSGPLGKLLLAQNGRMYGTLQTGLASNVATVFEYDLATNIAIKKVDIPASLAYFTQNVSLEQTGVAYRHDQTITIDPIADKTLSGPLTFTPTATATSGDVVTFSAGNNKITVANNLVTLVAAGKATLKANQPGNASYNAAVEAQLTFCVNPAKPTISFSGANTSVMTLSSSVTDGNQWYKDGVQISGATAKTMQVNAVGIYTVMSTVEDCASPLSEQFPVIVTGDIQENENTISLYPNPVQERLYIILPGGNRKHVTLINMNGRIAAEHQTSEKLLEVDVRDYSAGMYIVRITDETGERPAMKFIKK